jgi:putative FmdB family regulatory protein
MMPIYEYYCKDCRLTFEKIPINKQETLELLQEKQACPNCQRKVKKMPTAASFRLGEHLRSPNSPDAVAEATHERKQRRLKK